MRRILHNEEYPSRNLFPVVPEGTRISRGRCRFPKFAALTEQSPADFVLANPEVRRDVADNAGKRAYFYRSVHRHGKVMLAAFVRRQAQVAAALAGLRIAERLQRLGEIVAGNVARQAHDAARPSPA